MLDELAREYPSGSTVRRGTDSERLTVLGVTLACRRESDEWLPAVVLVNASSLLFIVLASDLEARTADGSWTKNDYQQEVEVKP